MSRINIPEADEILDLYFPMLDGNGFIALKDYMGSDESIAQSARNSYAGGTKTVSDNTGLIRRLMRDRHTSPFEFVEFTFHVRAPLYVIQQWLRHRTSNFCQESHRFSVIKDDFQTTKPDEWRIQDKNNKQGSFGFLPLRTFEQGEYNGEDQSEFEKKFHSQARSLYKHRISRGIAREQARKDVLHSTYSSIYIKCDLHNLLHFLRLRTAQDAQLEIRVYANMIAAMIKRVCPLTFSAWIDYSFCAKTFSRLDLEFLNWCQQTLTPRYPDENCSFTDMQQCYPLYKQYHEKIGMSKRELGEFWTKLIPTPIPDFDLDLSKAKTVEQMEKQ